MKDEANHGSEDSRTTAPSDETPPPDPKPQRKYKISELIEFERTGEWPEDADEDQQRLKVMAEQIAEGWAKNFRSNLKFRDVPKIAPMELPRIGPNPAVTHAADSREFYRQQQEWQDQLIASMTEAETHKRKQEQWANWQFWIVAIISFLSLVAAVVSIFVAAS